MQVVGWSHDVVPGAVALDDGTRAAFQRTLDQRMSGLVIHVGEGDALEGAWGRVRVDQDLIVAHDEVDPFKVGWDALRRTQDVGIHGTLTIELATYDLEELVHGGLNSLQGMRLELLEGVLHGQDIVTLVILFGHLLVEAVVDASLQNVGIVVTFDSVACSRIICGSVLAQQLDVLLRQVACLLNSLGSLDSTRGELLSLVLDLFVKTLQRGEHAAFQVLLGVIVHVHHALSHRSVMKIRSD